VNSSFYRIPYENVVKGWYNKTPDDFLFALKAPKLITHTRKLVGVEEPLSWFLERAKLLREKLGSILFQLPPSMKKNERKLEEFLSILPHGFSWVFEFRNDSWSEESVFRLLEKYKAAYCIVSAPHLQTHLKVTSSFAYVRFHGITGWYTYNYSDDDIRWWAERIRELSSSVDAVYAYFNNDFQCFAVDNARKLKELLG
jgi:uncharacterized protein YecE (DUF72 family)